MLRFLIVVIIITATTHASQPHSMFDLSGRGWMSACPTRADVRLAPLLDLGPGREMLRNITVKNAHPTLINFIQLGADPYSTKAGGPAGIKPGGTLWAVFRLDGTAPDGPVPTRIGLWHTDVAVTRTTREADWVLCEEQCVIVNGDLEWMRIHVP